MSAADLVTPLILTYNEEPNLARALDGLRWAREVVVLDSGSTDRTAQIALSYPNVRVVVRAFDTHAAQWAFGISSTAITTPYVLALDADYQVTAPFARELEERFAAGSYAGAIAGFDYKVLGQTLMGSVYPAKLVLFRRDTVQVSQPGHSQELHVDGPLYTFEARLVHEDRKPVARFASSQIEYSRLEALRLAQGTTSRWQDRARRTGLMPLIVGLGSWLKAGGPLRGSASLRYAYERVLFECLLAMRVLDSADRPDNEPRP